MVRALLLGGVGLILSGCAGIAIEGLAARAALGAGARGAAVEVATARAAAGGVGTLVETGALRAGTRLVIDPKLALTAEGRLGGALGELAAGRNALVIDSSGLISAGSQRIALLEGGGLSVEGQAVGVLQRGRLYEFGSSVPVARLRGVVPRAGTNLQLASGANTQTLRPMLVDVQELTGGRYLVRLASGEEAWIDAGLATVAVMALADAVSCSPETGRGVVIRTSGEPVVFDRCQTENSVLVLDTPQGVLTIDQTQVAEILSDTAIFEMATA